MDVRQLRYFIAIVECGSISRAAQRLNVAQPSLSLHVRNMEEGMGVKLLFRTAQGVQATEAGALLLHHAREIVSRFEEVEHAIRGVDAEPTGEVAIGLPSSIAEVLGVPLVRAARVEFPKIKLRVAEAMSGYVLDWLRQGRVDLGLLYAFVEDRELRSTGVLTETLVLFGAVDDPAVTDLASASDTIGMKQLAGMPMILPSPGHGLRDLVEQQAAKADVDITTQWEIDAYSAIKSLVGDGLGLSILPDHSVAAEVAAGRLHAWRFDPPFQRTVHIVEPANRPATAAMRAVERLCRRTLRVLVRDGVWGEARMRTSV